MKKLLLCTILLGCFALGFSQRKSKRKLPTLAAIATPQDSIMSNLLVGKWTDQNSTLQFLSNGNCSLIYDFDYQHLPNEGTWKVAGNRLLLTFRKQKSIDGVRPQYSDLYDLLYLSPHQFKYKLTDPSSDSTIWIANKIID